MNMRLIGRRSEPSIETQEPVTRREPDQRTLDFMDHHHQLAEKAQTQATQLSLCAVEKAALEYRIHDLETELAKSRRECSMYMRGYFSLHGKIGAFATLGSNVMRDLAAAAVKMIENSNEEMRAAGIVPPPSENPTVNETAEQHETVSAAERQE